MKKYIYNLPAILLILGVFFSTSSCSDDFVEINPEDENVDTFFNSEAEYQDALIGAYDLLQSTYLNVMVGEIASDNTIAGGENASDVPGIQEIDQMRHTPVNQQLRDIWNWMYAGVNRANFIMEFQDKTDFPDKANVIGQTRFLRAYYYFELVKWFGDVPLAIDKRIQFGDQFSLPRTPKGEVYAAIEEDLRQAALALEPKQDQIGRATKGAANALLGRVYLYQGKYIEAAAVLETVIASNVYSLVEDYASQFENDGENGDESIFEVQYSDLEGGTFDCLQCSEGNVAVGFNGIRNYSEAPSATELETNAPVFESGFSFNLPTQEMYDAFENNDIRRDVAILDIEAWATRRNATFAIGYPEGHTGYYNRKYIARAGDLNRPDANLTNPNNYRAIRYADVLLMAAEANNKGGGSDAKAQEYLNQVRNRAGLGNITAGGAELEEAIFNERRVELVGEGFRFFDLVRTNRAMGTIDGYTDKNKVFPIPAIEIELTNNTLTQNTGY